jgi:hypothetical protein
MGESFKVLALSKNTQVKLKGFKEQDLTYKSSKRNPKIPTGIVLNNTPQANFDSPTTFLSIIQNQTQWGRVLKYWH